MKPEEYIKNVTKTEPSTEDYQKIIDRLTPQTMRLLHAAMGLCTEAGEFLDALKKHIMYGKPIDETNLAEELGDGNWYEAIAIDELQRSFESIWERNIAKLKARYGDKFNEEGALNRNVNEERRILENKGLAVMCEHANEVPANCPCDEDCYCKTHTCATHYRIAGQSTQNMCKKSGKYSFSLLQVTCEDCKKMNYFLPE